jgi:uncharacterized protein (DUF433 family)
MTRYAPWRHPAENSFQPAWRDVSAAAKDGTVIWAILRDDLVARLGRPNLEPWEGVQLPLRHPGLAADGFDVGWNLAAPVGHGGFPDEWIAGWIPLPEPPRIESDPAVATDPDTLGGRARFAGTRVPIKALLANLADGLSLDETLAEFPSIERRHAVAVLKRLSDAF